jgi:endonuclease YncB( thermonuclease family)
MDCLSQARFVRSPHALQQLPKFMMPKTCSFVLLSILLLVSKLAAAETFFGYVVGVPEGDVITVLEGSSVYHKIRISGIDTPEKAQGLADRSKQNLTALAFGKPAAVQWSKLDRYGRILGKVTVDGHDLGLQQIEVGLAWCNDSLKEQSERDRANYEDAENQARAAGLGLWGEAHSAPPSNYRHHASFRRDRVL